MGRIRGIAAAAGLAVLAAAALGLSPAQGQRMPSRDKKSSWYFVAREDGITVHAKDHPKRKLPTFRGVGVVEGDFFEISAVMADTGRHPEWIVKCLRAELLEETHPFDVVIYNVSDAPWPVSDRDVVFRVTTDYEPKRGRMLIRFRNVTHPKKPPQEGMLRLPLLTGYYLLEAVDARHTKVTFVVDTDPGGLIPDWLITMVTRDYPLDTIRNLRSQLKKTRNLYAREVERFRTRYGDYRAPKGR